MCIQWTCLLYSVVIALKFIPPISQLKSLCYEFTSVWFVYYFFKWSLKKVECNNIAIRMSSKKCLHKNVVCNTPNVVCYNLLSATFC